jgi:hypothetical protein
MSSSSSNINSQDAADVFAQGLLQLLQPVVLECDARMTAVFNSQHLLSDQIDALSKGISLRTHKCLMEYNNLV